MEYDETDEYAEPELYRVVLMDKHAPPIDPFLDSVLMDVFHKNLDDALRLADKIRRKGKATVGAFTWDIAVSQARDVLKAAKEFGSTLQCMLIGEDDSHHKITYTAGKSSKHAPDPPNSVSYNTY